MKLQNLILCVLVAMLGLAFQTQAGKGEEEVALSKLPAAVVKAVKKAVPGIKLTEAERETKDSGVVYEVEGKVGEVEYEVKVTEAGKVLKIEKEDDDDDDDDDNDDDDEKK